MTESNLFREKEPVSQWAVWSPRILSVLRIVAAFLFIQSGTIKLFNFPMPVPPGVTITLASEAGIGGLLELVGGALLLFGLFTRPVAFILSGEMAVAYFQYHAPGGFWPAKNGGGDAMLFCFLWFYYFVAGPGPWSLDALLRKKR